MANGLPYSGWYNGDIEMIFANGTYADFRYMFERKVKLNKMDQKELDELDARWEAMPLEKRLALRNVVVEDSTPREVTVLTHDGPLVMMKSKPDEGNNVHIQRQKEKVKKERRLPAGALTHDNNPLKSLALSNA